MPTSVILGNQTRSSVMHPLSSTEMNGSSLLCSALVAGLVLSGILTFNVTASFNQSYPLKTIISLKEFNDGMLSNLTCTMMAQIFRCTNSVGKQHLLSL